MIIIVAKNVLKEGMSEEFKRIANELIVESRKEDGCISYVLHEDINNPGILTFIESWADQEAIDKHNATKHFTTIVPKLSEIAKESQVNLYKAL